MTRWRVVRSLVIYYEGAIYVLEGYGFFPSAEMDHPFPR